MKYIGDWFGFINDRSDCFLLDLRMCGFYIGFVLLLLVSIPGRDQSSAAIPLEGQSATSELAKPMEVTLRGKVIELTEALQQKGLPADEEPIAKQVVLLGNDGVLVPLLSDTASRGLFLDKRLQNRTIEIVGRRFQGIPYLQVVSFRVDDQGTLRTPEYYCDICTISVRFPQACPCCQGPMELRMRPEGR
jgi:hypothetical protein